MRFAAAVGAILTAAAALPSTAAFTVNRLDHQKIITATSTSSSTHLNYYPKTSGRSANSNNSMIILHNSLRDLLGTPNDKNHEILSNKNKNKKGDENTIDTSNADNFNNMLHPQRRNFQGRPSTDSGRINEHDDELGLNMDRLRAFSFAGRIAKENTRVKKGVKASSYSNRNVVVDTELSSYDDNTVVRANDFNNMIGIAYSKKSSASFTTNRNPTTQQNSSKDVDRETGMHTDKISTFSFSSQNTKSVFLERAVSGSNGGSSLREATWASKSSSSGSGGSGGGGDNVGGMMMMSEIGVGDDEDVIAAPADPAMNVDNFHNMVNVDISKNTGLKRLISPRTDGQVNHADRMATFSLLSTEDENDGSSTNIAPETLEVNHGDRMGTFSFASSSSSSGGSSITKKPKLQQIAAAASATPVVKNESKSQKSPTAADNSSTTTPPKKDNDVIMTTNNESSSSSSLDSRSQVYTPPQKGSLSSLASSLKTKSRADRIKEIKILTDPKLLHPDGMNIPRLNARGDVMSMSSTTGRMNVFERIEADLAANKSEDGGGVEVVAEKEEVEKVEEGESNNDDEEKDGDEKEDAAGEK
jgi:hypothetical protein